jgi:lipid-binding SYLF domain-containing protein
MQRSFIATALAMLALAAAGHAHAQGREEARLIIAAQVLDELRNQRDGVIPDRLLERAYGIAVIPEAKKAAIVAGISDGRGVMVVRDRDGRFTNPVFLRLTGGSFGWQLGVQETDIVLVFTTRKGVEGITGGKITLGVDASAAAGPVGRQASASTDASFSAEVYSYSRARGLFAGMALDGAVLRIDGKADSNFYGKPDVMASDILSGAVTSPSESVQRFLRAVLVSTRPGGAGAAAADGTVVVGSTAAVNGAGAAPAGAPAPAASSATKTFPMEDPQPGAEPPR